MTWAATLEGAWLASLKRHNTMDGFWEDYSDYIWLIILIILLQTVCPVRATKMLNHRQLQMLERTFLRAVIDVFRCQWLYQSARTHQSTARACTKQGRVGMACNRPERSLTVTDHTFISCTMFRLFFFRLAGSEPHKRYLKGLFSTYRIQIRT